MIAMLRGVVGEKLIDRVVVDVQGVGYGVYAIAEDYALLAVGDETKLYVYEHVREQAHDLFGFLSYDTQRLFEQLLDVSGVGPKMALNVLSIGAANDVRVAIAGGDVKFIQQANGVGKKVAERVVVELKDKVGLVGVDLEAAGLLQSKGGVGDEAVEALLALGYSPQDAGKALQGVDPELPTDARVKAALKGAAK